MSDAVTVEDIKRWYGAPSPVRAPLDEGEAESAAQRFRDKTVWTEPKRDAVRWLTLCCPWRVVWLTPGAYLGMQLTLPAGSYRVASFGIPQPFNVWFNDACQVSLLHAER